ncbi:dihydroorotate dehydrogenase, partial [Patescibacteria group bacterium]|nr:dihydroorotate dehydrogenase [Patescibacteria group bacterium]
MTNLAVEIAGIRLKNPTILASGVMGLSKASVGDMIDHGAGGCVIKSISKEPRQGHKAPNMHPVEGGFLNAVGYSNPGYEAAKQEFADLNDLGAPIWASITGQNVDDYSFLAENFLSDEFAGVEVVLSCPHTPGFGTMAGQNTPEFVEEVTKRVKAKTKIPVFIKLSPNSDRLGEVAKAGEAGGADGIVAVNTMGPGMYIDIKQRASVLNFG